MTFKKLASEQGVLRIVAAIRVKDLESYLVRSNPRMLDEKLLLDGTIQPEFTVVLQKRRLELLRAIAAFGKGEWRQALETYIVRSGPCALDELLLLVNGEVDDLVSEILPRLATPWQHDLSGEDSERLRDAVNSALVQMLHAERTALIMEILSQQNDGKTPVCLAFLRRTLRKLLT
jgi:hypothetical protein